MRRYILFFIMVLPLCGCESIEVGRYLQSQFCPDALILKGAERLTRARDGRPVMEAELMPLQLSCDIETKGEIGEASFAVTGMEFDITFRGQTRWRDQSSKSANLPLFAVLLRKRDNHVFRPHIFTIPAGRGDFSTSIRLALPSAVKVNSADYVLLGGFVVNEAQIDNNFNFLKKIDFIRKR